MIRHAKRMIAMLLAVIMLMQISPITQMKVFAADESMGEAVEAEQLAEILYEDVTQRDENSKRYRLGDGKWVAAVYEDAVHYEVDGQWEDIDNTLKSSTESYRIPVEPGKVTGEYTVNGFVEIGDTEVMSEITEIPEPSEAPELAPEVTEEPEEVTESEVTETPEDATEPEAMETLENVTEPDVTETPEEITNTEATETLEDVTEPEVTGTPEDVTEPEVTGTPEEVIESETSETPETETEEIESGQTTIVENAAVELLPITPPVVTLEPITPDPGFKNVSEQVWVNTANDIGISLPATLSGDSRVRVSSKGYALYFAPVLENGKSDGNVSLMTLREQGIAAQQIAIDNGSDDVRLKGIENKARSGLTYANVLPGVNMEYHLQSRTLKETIIIDRLENMPATISYTISAAGLTPVVNEDNSIYFVADGEIIFCLPAPYMFDSVNAVSFDIAVSLQALDNGEYLMTYTPDAEWINAEDRAWPVCIDPVVGISPSTSTVEDTFVCANAATTNYEGLNYLYVGKLDSEGAARAFVKFKSLPSLTSSDVVINAYMYMQGIEMSGSQMTVSAYAAPSAWNKSTLNWNTKPVATTAALDYQIVAYANRYKSFCWDITQVAKQWYNGGANNGVELRSDAESNSTGVVIKFGSAERDEGLRPKLMIYYTSNTGLESFWDYTSQDVGRAGTAHVNNYTGNFVVSRTDMSYGGNKMPAAITFNYNYTDRVTDLGYGNGWRMNYNHKITIEQGATSSGNYSYYRWVDGDGTRRNFNFASSHWYDETGQGYILTENTGSTTARFVITDKSGSRLEFDGYGRLKKVVDPNVSSNCVTIEYVAASSTNLRIKKITDGAGRVYQFEYYNDTNLLKEVSYYGTGTGKLNTVTYEYGSTTLTKVKYNDNDANNNGAAGYEYSSTALTKLSNNANSESVTVTYTSGNQVDALTYKDGTADVSSATFEYGGDNTKVTDMQGCWVTYQFNDFGNTTGVFNDRGQAVFGSYAQDKDSSARANQLVDSSRLQDTVVNLIKDPSFEKATSMWSCSSNAEIVAEQVNNVYQSSTGQKMAKLSAKDAYVQYPSAFTAGETYTISVAVKTKDGGKVQIEAASTATGTVKSEPLSTNDWTRLELTFTATANTTVKFKSVQSGTGVVYLDDAQLELTDASSRYNLLTNGDFTEFSTASGWDISGWTSHGTSGVDGHYISTDTAAWTPEVTDQNVLILDKSYLVEKSAYQVVEIPGGQPGDKYTFGVWVKSPSVPLDNSRAPGDTAVRRCGIKVRAVGANGEVASEQILINDACNDWQYLCGSLECDENYTSVEVYLLFSYCQNTAMFDGAQLFRESYGYHYEYDDDGNVTSVTDLSGNKTTYAYEDGNSDVTEITMPNGGKYYYDYNSARQVIEDTNTLGTTNQYTYDSYGNLTKQTTGYSGASASIVSESTYEGNGNMTKMVTTADRQTITYSNNLNLSLVNSVTDPLGRVTSYTYDTMDRPLTVTRNSSVLTYTYSADAVSAISHTGGNGSNGGPTTYTFNYGVADVLQSVGIKKDTLLLTLVTNDYYDGVDESGSAEPKTWNLKSQTYGNGQLWSYQYYEDSAGHQTSELKSKILHNDDATKSVKYKYVYYYSSDGAVGRIEYYEGSTLKQVEKYYYDTADRLCRVVGLNGSTTNPSVLYEYSWTYDHNNNVTNLVEIIDGVKTVYNYGYNTEQQASSTAYGNTHKTFAYDGYGRFSNSIVNYNGAERVKEYVEYKTTGGYATNQVSRFISKWSRNALDTSSDIYQYTYDANGNITEIKDGSGNYLVKYQYDSNDQLQWEWNHQTNQAWYYGYDTGGNILYKHFYSNKEGTTKTDTIYYSYDGTWGDKLTKYDGVDTGADASGNIKNLNGWSYTYQGGRQLATASTTGKNLSFAYNDAGLRTSKTYNGTVHTYTYNGSLLASDVVKNANGVLQYAFYFRYDQNGAPIGFGYKSSSSAAIVEYYYLKNLQGDITGIVDTSGNRVATYVYDAWGNHLSITGSNTDLANKNPLRYRGYVYDTESSLYYLQSRYYSPAIGRFISADAYAMTYETPTGANMFAYCGNNPVSMADDGGQWAHLVIGALVGGAINVASSYITYKTVGMEYSKESLAVDFVSGAASGALAASRVDLVGSVVANAVIGGASYMIGQSIKEEDVTLKGFSTAVIAGTVSGFVGGKGANGASIKSKLSVCKQVLKSSTSPKKTSMYSNKLNDVFGEIVINAARAMLASHSSNLINNNIS